MIESLFMKLTFLEIQEIHSVIIQILIITIIIIIIIIMLNKNNNKNKNKLYSNIHWILKID